jgi:hypothetical protein
MTDQTPEQKEAISNHIKTIQEYRAMQVELSKKRLEIANSNKSLFDLGLYVERVDMCW